MGMDSENSSLQKRVDLNQSGSFCLCGFSIRLAQSYCAVRDMCPLDTPLSVQWVSGLTCSAAQLLVILGKMPPRPPACKVSREQGARVYVVCACEWGCVCHLCSGKGHNAGRAARRGFGGE